MDPLTVCRTIWSDRGHGSAPPSGSMGGLQSQPPPTVAQGLTPTHLGTCSGETATIKLLLRHGWPVDVRSASGHTALHYASMRDQQDAVRLLLQRGADPVARDLEQTTPLLLAADAGHVQVMRQLLHREKEIQQHLPALVGRKIPPSYEQVLVPYLLNGNTHLNEIVGGRTVLHQAAQSGHIAVARFVLRNGVQGSIKDREGRIPAQVAAIRGHIDMVYILDPEPLYQVERLIHNALRQRKVMQVRSLLTAAPRSLRKQVKAMALAAAALTQREPLTITLKRSISVDEDQGWGWRPLYMAALRGEEKAMQLLLTHGASPNLKTHAGTTPLLQAAKGGRPNLIRLLLGYGADIEERDPMGHTALQVAARCGQGTTVVPLLEGGANAYAQDPHRQTALDLALDRGAKRIVESITQFLARRGTKQ